MVHFHFELPVARPSVIVGLSGGVDSAVSAALLIEQGYAVSGLFMKNWEEDDGTEYCTAEADLEDAQRVSDHLGIPLRVANFAAEYWDDVFECFLRDYRAGLTPNPDVLCNREIKFKQFARYARTLGAEHVATGHYARVTGSGTSLRLLKGIDANKDQSYFLQAVTQTQLEGCLFPLGELTKPEVRSRAEALGLHNHRKKDSTGICFIGERRFADFLSRYVPRCPGPMRTPEGLTVGEHQGLPYYTIGQRQGLGIGGRADAAHAPWYVVAKHERSNTLIVSQQSDHLMRSWLAAEAPNWLAEPKRFPFRCNAKIRYRQSDQAAVVSLRADGRLRVTFDEPQRAITPGQYVCFYDDDVVIGGAVISR